jgi:hypothetical protein
MNITAGAPRLLRIPEHGICLEFKVGRVWTKVIEKDPREVTVKKIRNIAMKAAIVVNYPQGLEVAIDRFLNPVLGLAVVSPNAKTILENIMKFYTTKTNAVRALKVIDPALVDRAGYFIDSTPDGFKLDDDAARAAASVTTHPPKPAKAPKAEKTSSQVRSTNALIVGVCETHRKQIMADMWPKKEFLRREDFEGIDRKQVVATIRRWAWTNRITPWINPRNA